MHKLKTYLATNFPRLKLLYKLVRNQHPRPTFNGWGMTTETTSPPWLKISEESQLNNVQGFLAANNELLKLVGKQEFNLTQFKGQDHSIALSTLEWRHYIVYWTAHYAIKNSSSKIKRLVECGVCDGLTIFYAIQASINLKSDYEVYLYDAWDSMRSQDLLDTEKSSIGSYSYLDLDNTKKNLSRFADHITYNKGYIPESFNTGENPSEIIWLHIDLNSAIPTHECLEFFFNKISPGGLMLFDDYGWNGYEDTKVVINKFLHGKNAELLQIPTGQAIAFKR